MSHNIFLTGDLHVGKSTMIHKIMDEFSSLNILGFRTSRYYQNRKLQGFYMEDIQKECRDPRKQFIGKCTEDDHWISIPSTFNDPGVQILESCLLDNPDFVVMDELGFFESKAMEFQRMVKCVLDSEIPVLGVLKQKHTAFLDEVRNRDDVTLFDITTENRDEMLPVIIKEVYQLITKMENRIPSHNITDFSNTIREIFALVYPVVAKQIQDRTQINTGLCVDLGTGTGELGIEMAKISDLHVYILDNSYDMLALANENVERNRLEHRVKTIYGDVHNIPLRSNHVDLIVSRGSYYFWEDKAKALMEIYRVLKPHGIAYIGGGFGTEEIKAFIHKKMQDIDEKWSENYNKKVLNTNTDYLHLFKMAGINNVKIIQDSANMWFIISKFTNETDNEMDLSDSVDFKGMLNL